MSNLRATHKARLKEILESLVFEGSNLVVFDSYQNNGDFDPYFFIVSTGLNPNQGGEGQNTLYDTGNYQRVYSYQIVSAWRYDEPSKEQEDRIDAVEALVIDCLQSKNTRDDLTRSDYPNSDPNWLDLIVTDISEVFSPEPSLQSTLVYKIFTVEIENIVNYV